MIRKESLTKQEIKLYLNAEKQGISFSIQIGINVISIAVFFISFLTLVIPFIIDRNFDTFWFIVICFFTTFSTLLLPAIACFKYTFFEKIFPFAAVVVALIAASMKGGIVLITPLVLYAVLGVIYLLKQSKCRDMESALALREKFVFIGTLISVMQERENVNYGSGMVIRSYWSLLVNDGSQEIFFKLSNEKVLGMFLGDNQKLDLKKMEKMQVEASFITPDKLLNIVPLL